MSASSLGEAIAGVARVVLLNRWNCTYSFYILNLKTAMWLAKLVTVLKNVGMQLHEIIFICNRILCID